MSLGFQPAISTVLNPLDLAVQAVWGSGIAVVVSAGNAGPFNGTILSPGDDPLVITVGALDDMASSSVSGDEMTDFSSAGPTSPDGWVKPDLVTSGRSVVSLAAPGSTVYDANPSALVGSANFVGSGTSFSSAITSGAAALVLADNPGLSPNQLKARLLGTTNPGPVGNPFVDGHGALNAYAAATAGPMNLSQSAALLLPTLPGVTVPLSPTGSVDTWNLSLWSGISPSPGPSGSTWGGRAWNGSDWNGFTWTGRAWNEGDWAGASWNGADWTGRAWNDAGWAGSVWDGSAWTGSGLEQFGMELRPAPSDLRIPRATGAVVWASVAGGVLTLLVAMWRQPGLLRPDERQWVVAATMGALVLGSWIWPVVVYREGESEAFNMDEGFFVILALLVPPLVTLGTLGLATAMAQAIRRRPLVKSAFNTGQVLIAAGLGISVSRGIAAPSASLTAGQVAAVVLGVGVYHVVNTLLVAGVVISMGTYWRELIDDLPVQVTLAGAAALVGVLLALAMAARPWVLALAVPGLIMQRRLISARFAALHDHTRMKGLYEVTLEANRGLRHQAVLDTILASVRRLLRSPEATLTSELPPPGQLAAPMMVADRQMWLAAAAGAGTSPSTMPTGACCGPWPPWAAERSATPSCITRSASSASGCPRSRSASGKVSAPWARTGS